MVFRTGFDTGFFVLLAAGRADAIDLWREVVSGDREGIISAVTLFELARLGLRGALDANVVETLHEALPEACEVVWIDRLELLRAGARLAQGHALSLADALILASLVGRECGEIYTTDRDLAAYRSGSVRVINLHG